MKALDIIKKSAVLLNEKKILDDEAILSLNSANESSVLDNNFTLNRMLEILRIVLTELSCDYVQIVKEKTCTASNLEISLSNFDNLFKVLEVRKEGIKLPFKIDNNAIIVKYNGEYQVKYLVSPVVESVLDEVDVFNGMVSYDLFVYGLTAMYCLAIGLFDEFNIYNSIYEQKLSALKTLKVITMPMRSWE